MVTTKYDDINCVWTRKNASLIWRLGTKSYPVASIKIYFGVNNEHEPKW